MQGYKDGFVFSFIVFKVHRMSMHSTAHSLSYIQYLVDKLTGNNGTHN